MYAAEVLEHSIADGCRELFTVQITHPRFILAEVNTHGRFALNSASSRAIPPERSIEQVRQNLFMPEAFHRRVKGMGQGAALDEGEQEAARLAWTGASELACQQAEELMALEVSKAHVNRLLEPFKWHTTLLTGTEFDNFFALRAPAGDEVDYTGELCPAQPEFQRIAIMMRQAMRDSKPRYLEPGEWHLPFVADADRGDSMACGISAGRCARVSFERQDEAEPASESIDRSEKLGKSGHMSPFEHQARPMADEDRVESPELWSKLVDWVQYRKLIPYEENRVGFLADRLDWRAAAA